MLTNKGESHADALRVVFDRLRLRGATLNPKKCEFAQTEVNYLGYRVGQRGVSLLPNRIESIVKYPVQKNLRQLKTFIGMSSYCRNFVPYFAAIAVPLHLLDKKGVAWEWTNVHQVAFDTIKAALADARVMQIFDPLKQLTIQADASKTGIGAVLLQPDGEGNLRPIEYDSRRTTPAERNYPPRR